jgi:PAS domain S-box-containing protein
MHTLATETPEQLQAEIERLRAIIEHSAEGVLLLSADRQTRYISPTITALLGYSPEEFAALSARDLTHPADQQSFDTFIATLLAQPGATARITSRVQHRDGSWRCLDQRGSNQIQNPTLGAIIISFHDVTEQMRAELALRQSEERFAKAFRASPSALAIVRMSDAELIDVNSGFATLFGTTPDALIGRSALELDVFANIGEIPELLRLLRERGMVSDIEYTVRLPTGEQHTALGAVELIELAGEECVLVLGIDITARKQAEDALRRAADRLTTLHAIDRAILELHTPTTIASAVLTRIRELIPCQHTAVVLRDGDSVLGQVLASNGEVLHTIADGARVPMHSEAEWATMRRGEPLIDNDLQAEHYDHPIVATLTGAGVRAVLRVPLLAHWELIGMLNLAATAPGAFTDEHVAIAQEIGDMLAVALHNARLVESLQQELAARERAEAALIAEHARVIRLKNEFMATMSHELRTPLAAVLGRAELLLDGVYGSLNERQSAAVRTVEQSGRSLLALINDILDYSKFEAGQIALDLAPTMVSSVCRDSVRAVAQSALHKHIVLTSTLDGAVTAIQADAKRLQQLLVNLLSNAIKFTPEGGEAGLEVRGDAEREQVTFTVWDTGIGIAETDLGRLFQPFTQLDSRLSRQYEGTGLGLALVRRLAEAHGGSVSVQSVPGHGSRFSITLPWVVTPPDLGAPLAVPAAPLARFDAPARDGAQAPTILLVEDRESNIALLQDALPSHGYAVEVARDGTEALALAREARPKLVLMDIQLPGMSGLEVTHQMRADEQLRHIPIVALTALVMPGDRERCLQAGADEYLAKPVAMRTLLDTIARLIERRRVA